MQPIILNTFISSTWLDLQPERKSIENVLQRMREIKYVGMEYFGSCNEPTRGASVGELDRSHVYVGIFAARYGSGITEEEYRRAQKLGLNCFIYFKDESVIPLDLRETDPEQIERLNGLKEELRQAHTISTFTCPDELAYKVATDLHNWLFREFLTSKLKGALQGEVTHAEAQSLLNGVIDLQALDQDLLAQMRSRGYVITSRASALHQLPPPPRSFTGRIIQLREFITKLEPSGASISGLHIHGLGGVGKTAFALKLAEQITSFYDAQLYLDLKGTSVSPTSVAEVMAYVIRSYHPLVELPDNEAELSGMYRSVLHGQHALLLLDNARTSEQIEPLIPPTSCALIVTSRERFTLPGIPSLPLAPLPSGEARDLLLTISPRIGGQADAVAELCGFLPLALRVAASSLEEHVDIGVEEFVQRLTSAQQRLELVSASLSLSYELLAVELRLLWCALAVFPDTFNVAAAAVVWNVDNDAAKNALSELVRLSLVEWVHTTDRYRLHDLVRLFASNNLDDTQREEGKRNHSRHYLDILRESNSLYRQGGESLNCGIAQFDLEWNNIEAGQLWAQTHAQKDNEAAQLSNAYPDLGGSFLALHRHPRERIRWFEAGLAAARGLKDRAAEARHLINLGRAHYLLSGLPGRPVELYEQALSIARDIGDRESEGQALGNIGVVYREQGQSHRAIEVFEQRLEIARELNDLHGEANTLGNLGRTYWTMGNSPRTVEYCTQQLQMSREIGDRNNEARALGNLAQAYMYLHDLPRAIELSEQSLAIQRALGNLRGVGSALGTLGKAYYGLRQHQRALEYYEQSLTMQRQAGHVRAQAYALSNLGKCYYRLGEMRRSIECHEQQLDIARETGDKVAEGMALFSIGCVLYKQGEHVKATKYAESALQIFELIEDPHANKVRQKLAEWLGQELPRMGDSTIS